MLVSARSRTARCRGPWKTRGGWVRDQHLTITEVFFRGRRSERRTLRCNKSLGLCRRHVNIPSGNSFRRETLKPSSEKFLTFVNPVFPARVEYVKRLPAWRFARGANRK